MKIIEKKKAQAEKKPEAKVEPVKKEAPKEEKRANVTSAIV